MQIFSRETLLAFIKEVGEYLSFLTHSGLCSSSCLCPRPHFPILRGEVDGLWLVFTRFDAGEMAHKEENLTFTCRERMSRQFRDSDLVKWDKYNFWLPKTKTEGIESIPFLPCVNSIHEFYDSLWFWHETQSDVRGNWLKGSTVKCCTRLSAISRFYSYCHNWERESWVSSRFLLLSSFQRAVQ